MTDLLLYGKTSFDTIQNKKILTVSVKYIVDPESFTGFIVLISRKLFFNFVSRYIFFVFAIV